MAFLTFIKYHTTGSDFRVWFHNVAGKFSEGELENKVRKFSINGTKQLTGQAECY